MLQKHKNGNLFYTDASKSEEVVLISIIGENLTSTFKLPETQKVISSTPQKP